MKLTDSIPDTQDEDPTRSRFGNNAPTLLNAQPSAADPNKSTALHLMGFTFLAPDPKLPIAPEQLCEFNAVVAMQESVLDATQLVNLPPTPPAQTDSLPSPATATRDGPKKLQNWTTAQAAWNAADANIAAMLTQTWTGLFGWADPSKVVAPNAQPAPVKGSTAPPAPPVYPVQPFTPLDSRRPQDLIDGLQLYYLGAPTLSVIS